MEFKHIPVMLEPCMELLGLDRHPDGVFVDGTLGGGGHRGAAGATVNGTMAEAEDAILRAYEEVMG